MMNLWGALQCVLMDGSQVAPEKRGLKLGEVGKLFESAVPYRRCEVGYHYREAEKDDIRNHGVWTLEVSRADEKKSAARASCETGT